MRTLLVSLAFCAAFADVAGAADLLTDTASLVRGNETSVAVVETDDTGTEALGAGWVVSASYFPNSVVTRIDSLGMTDSAGTVTWEPEFAGIVTLTARRGDKTASLNVSVRFPGVPPGAVLVFFAAGMILLGGAGWSFMHLLERAPLATDGEGDDE